MTHLAIFASGAGSNARKIIEYFDGHPQIRVSLVVCNKPGAGVLKIAEEAGIPTLLIEKERFFKGDGYLPALQSRQIGFVVLAGFLWKIPEALIQAYPRRIVNIHPALLPKYGGKGMYGGFVHSAVLQNRETETGITIHFVDEHYDNGDIIFQATCKVDADDTAESVAQKVHQLEHRYFPEVIEKTVLESMAQAGI